MKGLITFGIGQGGDIGLWALNGLTAGAAQDTGGGTTLSARGDRTTSAEEVARQRMLNRHLRMRRAEREAEEIVALPKAEAKKRVRKAYRVVSKRAIPGPSVIEVVSPFAPALAKTLALPPEKAVKFDVFARDQRAIALLYVAYLEEIDRALAEEEAAIVSLLMN